MDTGKSTRRKAKPSPSAEQINELLDQLPPSERARLTSIAEITPRTPATTLSESIASRQDLMTKAMVQIHQAKAINRMVGFWLTTHDGPSDEERDWASLALAGAEDLLDGAHSAIDSGWLERGAQS